jgi:hypothetical protein
VSRSSAEAEYKAMADATTEVMRIQSILRELQVPRLRCARLWCDNLRGKYLASNPIFHGRMKHVKIDYHFVQDQVLQKLLDVRFISSRPLHESNISRPVSGIPAQSQSTSN